MLKTVYCDFRESSSDEVPDDLPEEAASSQEKKKNRKKLSRKLGIHDMSNRILQLDTHSIMETKSNKLRNNKLAKAMISKNNKPNKEQTDNKTNQHKKRKEKSIAEKALLVVYPSLQCVWHTVTCLSIHRRQK